MMCAKCSLAEHLAVVKVIIKDIVFLDITYQRISKQLGTQIYELCNSNGYLCSMKVYNDMYRCNSDRSVLDTIWIISCPDLC